VVDVLVELLVATKHHEFAGHVSASPVEGVLANGFPDELRPDLLASREVGLGGDTDVELVRDLEVHGGLHGNDLLLVVLGSDVHGHLDTTKVFALNVQAGSDLMFLVSGLLLTSQGDADFPVFLIDELTLGIRGQLVVGEREACLAVAVVDLQLAGGLLNLRAGAVFGDGALDLLLHVEAKVFLGLGTEGEFPVDAVIAAIGIVGVEANAGVYTFEEVSESSHRRFVVV